MINCVAPTRTAGQRGHIRCVLTSLHHLLVPRDMNVNQCAKTCHSNVSLLFRHRQTTRCVHRQWARRCRAVAAAGGDDVWSLFVAYSEEMTSRWRHPLVLVSRRYDNVSCQSATYQSTSYRDWPLISVDDKVLWSQWCRPRSQALALRPHFYGSVLGLGLDEWPWPWPNFRL